MKQLSLKYFLVFCFANVFLGCFSINQDDLIINKGESINFVNKGIFYLEQYDMGNKESLVRSRASFEIAKEIEPKSPLPYDGLACVEIRLSNYSEATRLLKIAIDKDPAYGRPYANLAFIAQHEKRFDEAKSLLNKAIELNQFDSHAINNLGSLLFRQLRWSGGNGSEALGYFTKARELYTGNSKMIEENIEIVEASSVP